MTILRRGVLLDVPKGRIGQEGLSVNHPRSNFDLRLALSVLFDSLTLGSHVHHILELQSEVTSCRLVSCSLKKRRHLLIALTNDELGSNVRDRLRKIVTFHIRLSVFENRLLLLVRTVEEAPA